MTSTSTTHQAKWNARYASKDLVWSQQPNPLVAHYLRPLMPGTALDIGCGEGRNALWLAEQGWNVTGIDFSDVAIDKARQITMHRSAQARSRGQLNWQACDIAAEPPKAQSVDLIMVVFLHTDPDSRAIWLPKAIDAVKPGGHFLYVGHDPSNVGRGTGGPQDVALLPGVSDISALLGEYTQQQAKVVERDSSRESGHGSSTNANAFDTLVLAQRN